MRRNVGVAQRYGSYLRSRDNETVQVLLLVDLRNMLIESMGLVY